MNGLFKIVKVTAHKGETHLACLVFLSFSLMNI